MDEKRKEELNVKENKLMIRQAGVIAIMIILYIPYFNIAAYLSNQYFFSSYYFALFIWLLGIPLTYFAAKYLVWLIKNINTYTK
ncbi:hypothetical protein [Solibacillus sp. FSL K6-4121]|uniref:hypothetical protein n=1 Tax=Solibacillus sp. FSL K6-4121 TaxID=2921505 RepID=UPI0030F8BF7A